MRILIFFDLPVETAAQRRDYRKFRKFLIKSGFLMLQESVYCKLAQNGIAANSILRNVEKNRPPAGLVQALKITEKQFENMIYIVGKKHSDVLDTDERLVVL
jgi:CRISPR-associated protein Cas2